MIPSKRGSFGLVLLVVSLGGGRRRVEDEEPPVHDETEQLPAQSAATGAGAAGAGAVGAGALAAQDEAETEHTAQAGHTVQAERTEQLAEMSAAELKAETDSPIGRVPYRRFMGIRVFDCWVHEDDIRQAVGMQHHLGTDAGQFALGEIVRALPRIVGKKAGAPEGARVRFRVTGDADTDLSLNTDVVVVNGRATLTDVDGTAQPTVELVFDTPTFVRAATGRITAEPGNGVEVSGDEELGRAILGSMAFTM